MLLLGYFEVPAASVARCPYRSTLTSLLTLPEQQGGFSLAGLGGQHLLLGGVEARPFEAGVLSRGQVFCPQERGV